MEKTLEDFYGCEVPGYVIEAGKSFITIWVDDRKRKITQQDIIRYFCFEACNIVSGCRTLAGIVGDWRPIDNLAQECLAWFKFRDIDGLRKLARRNGLEPRF